MSHNAKTLQKMFRFGFSCYVTIKQFVFKQNMIKTLPALNEYKITLVYFPYLPSMS